jgi:TolB protein
MIRCNLYRWTTVSLAALAFAASPMLAQTPLGIFEGHADVGAVLHPGSASYDPATKTYTLTGSGENMWIRNDAFQFLFKKASGDLSITADIRFPQAGGNPHRKAALILRQSLDASAVYADAALHGVGLTALQFRMQAGAVTGSDELNFATINDAPMRFRLEKRGDHITMFVSHNGGPLRFSGAAAQVHLEGDFYIGLGICAHDKDAVEKAVFSNVEIKPIVAEPSAKPELYSTLKTISIDRDNPRAMILYSALGHFEAPNWTRDGKSLIFDQGGRLITISADGGTPQAIDIGAATGCNGSHGLSPDGKWLAISCATPGNPGSRVYIVPSGGGTPRMVTQNPSSYFHSWSPDGKTIAFTRPHPGGGDIFSIAVEGGAETRLTDSVMSDDPDYSPDGKLIYFNSDRAGGGKTGLMQIWRMQSDGSHPEQVTFDERNNWTPHVSPDGKYFSYLSYDKSVTGHPANKDISLRVFSLADNKVNTVVDIFGGTGTINVPSWSPDSKHFAFVGYELVNP